MPNIGPLEILVVLLFVGVPAFAIFMATRSDRKASGPQQAPPPLAPLPEDPERPVRRSA